MFLIRVSIALLHHSWKHRKVELLDLPRCTAAHLQAALVGISFYLRSVGSSTSRLLRWLDHQGVFATLLILSALSDLAIPTHQGNRRCKQASNAQALNAKSLVYSNSDEYCTAVSCRAKLNANDTTPLLSRWSRNRSFRKNFAQNSVQRSRGEKASMSFKIQLPH